MTTDSRVRRCSLYGIRGFAYREGACLWRFFLHNRLRGQLVFERELVFDEEAEPLETGVDAAPETVTYGLDATAKIVFGAIIALLFGAVGLAYWCWLRL